MVYDAKCCSIAERILAADPMISVSPLHLPLRHAFRIAHGSSTERTNAVVAIGSGVGEAALPPYYPTTLDDVRAYVDLIQPQLEDVLVRKTIPVTSFIQDLPPGPAPARAAVDMALHDVLCKRLDIPLHVLLGTDPRLMPISSYALPIPQDEADLMSMLRDVNDFPFLKLKIGSGDIQWDEAIVRLTRSVFKGTLCVDVNARWPMDTAIEMIGRLADTDLAFIEQPIPADDIDDWHLLRRLLPQSGIPFLIADESVQAHEDVIMLAGAADGINIKLAKCGGILAARELITLARSLDMSVMIGCMIESSIAMTSAAHLGPLADYLDLDGPMHLASDPYQGLTFDKGRISIPDRAGLGVQPA